MDWKELPNAVQTAVGVGILVGGIAAGVTYHDKFVTKVMAEEQKQELEKKLTAQQVETGKSIQYLLVLNMESKKDIKIKEKAQAVAAGDVAKAEELEQGIQTLRDKISGLCDDLDDC